MTQGTETRGEMEICSSNKESIHSGHFMVSDIDDSEVQDDDDTVSVPISEGDIDAERQPCANKGYDFEGATKQTSKTYMFGPRSCKSVSIDATLTKLFQCMTLAYRGKLTSPRWKNFKGLKLRWKDKIRLNNVIWRAWHMQFVEKRNTVVCQFQSPLDTEAHIKPEAVVLEGKYWKRQLETVRAEYKSWRLFTQQFSKDHAGGQDRRHDMFEYNYDWQPRSNQSAYSCSMIVDDDPFNEFNDTLFSCLIPNQPFAFPNPREIARAGIADFIQPGLLPFQPNLDDCMDTFDWFSDIFSSISSRLPPVAEEPESNVLNELLEGTSSNMPQQNGSGYLGLEALVSGQGPPEPHQPIPRGNGMFRTKTYGASAMSTAALPSMMNNCAPSTSSFVAQNINAVNAGPFPAVSLEPGIAMDTCNLDSKLGATNVQANLIDSNLSLDSSVIVQQQQQHSSPVASPGLYSITPPPPSDCLFASHGSPPCSQTAQQQQSSLQMNLPIQHMAGSPPAQVCSLPQSPGLSAMMPPPRPPPPPPPPPPPSQTAPSSSQQLAAQAQREYIDIHPNFSSYGHPKNLAGILRQPPLVPPQPPSPPSPPVILPESHNTVPRTATDASPGNQIRRLSVDHEKGVIRIEKDDNVFLVPKPKPRMRSRSGPSLGQLLQSHSSRSSPPATMSAALSTSSIHTVTCSPPVHIAPSPVTISTSVVPSSKTSSAVLPRSALLAQLLSTGTYTTTTVADKTNTTTTKNSSPTTVAILPNSPSTQTVVITPVTLATVTAVSHLQNQVLVGAANQVFGNLTLPSKVVLPPASTANNVTTATTMNCVPQGNSITIDGDHRVSSQPKPFRPKSETERVQYKEHRRVSHINAEQKRRCNIKNGFDTLHHLVPSLGQNPNGKVSKAAMLQKAGEYIKQLKGERAQLQEEAVLLKKQIESLNQAIKVCQSQLPATGAPVPCQRPNKIHKMFEEYVRNRTLQNWKFWIFSIIIRPLLESYNNTVSTANMDDLCKTVLTWLEQHCSLVALRPGVFNSLKHLSTTTNILSDPNQIQEEAVRAVRTVRL